MTDIDTIPQAINSTQVNKILKRSQRTLYASGILALLVIVALWQTAPRERLLAWALISAIVLFARWYIMRRAMQEQPFSGAATSWLKWHNLGATAAGLAWGVGVFLLKPSNEGLQQVLIPVAVMALAFTAVAGHPQFRSACLGLWLASLLPLAAFFALEGGTIGYVLGAVVLVFLAILYWAEGIMAQQNVETATISNPNHTIHDRLIDEQREVQRLSQQLKEQTIALMESDARLRLLSESSFEGIVIFDSGVIKDLNPVISSLLGYAHSELIGMPVLELFAPASREPAESHFFSGYQKPFEVMCLRRDGTTLPVEIQAKTLPYKGALVQMIAVRDLTDRKLADRQAIILQIEKERVQLLTSFMQNASHEFRTPLTIIMTVLHLMKRQIPDMNHDLVNRIRDQVKRLDSLVESQLLMVQLDTSIELSEMLVSINELLRAAWESIHGEWEANEVQLETDFANNIPRLQCDETLLKYAFHALLHNAVRYSRKGGVVSITSASDDHEVIITIRDTGIGMDETVLPHIFDRFYRGDEARTTSGFGLGLSIAQKIIEYHNGTIMVQSRNNTGTTVTVKLPLDKIPISPGSIPQ